MRVSFNFGQARLAFIHACLHAKRGVYLRSIFPQGPRFTNNSRVLFQHRHGSNGVRDIERRGIRSAAVYFQRFGVTRLGFGKTPQVPQYVALMTNRMREQEWISFFARQGNGFRVRSQRGLEIPAIALALPQSSQRKNPRLPFLRGTRIGNGLDICSMRILDSPLPPSPGSLLHQFR